MLRVYVRVEDGSSKNAEVSGVGDDPRTLGIAQSAIFDLPDDGTLSVKAGDFTYLEDGPKSTDVFVDGKPNVGNPNGITQAQIAPKFPKAGGETEQVPTSDGRVLERTINKDPALAVAAGGPEGAEEGKTPGPQPTQDAPLTGSTAGATGTSHGGKPTGESQDAIAKTSTGQKPAGDDKAKK